MKPTAIVGTFRLLALALRCDRDRRPHPHDPLTGTVVINGKKLFKTRLAQVYPTQLCNQWAGEICRQLGAKTNNGRSIGSGFHHGYPYCFRKETVVGATCSLGPSPSTRDRWKRSSSGGTRSRKGSPAFEPVEMEPGEAVRFALNLVHPFTGTLPIDPHLQEFLSLAVNFSDWLNNHRMQVLPYWEQQAVQLLPETAKILKKVPDPHLRRLVICARSRRSGSNQVRVLFSHFSLEGLDEASQVDRRRSGQSDVAWYANRWWHF